MAAWWGPLLHCDVHQHVQLERWTEWRRLQRNPPKHAETKTAWESAYNRFEAARSLPTAVSNRVCAVTVPSKSIRVTRRLATEQATTRGHRILTCAWARQTLPWLVGRLVMDLWCLEMLCQQDSDITFVMLSGVIQLQITQYACDVTCIGHSIFQTHLQFPCPDM